MNKKAKSVLVISLLFIVFSIFILSLVISQNSEKKEIKEIKENTRLSPDYSDSIHETIYNFNEKNQNVAQNAAGEDYNALNFKKSSVAEGFINEKSEKGFNLKAVGYDENQNSKIEFIYYQQEYNGVLVYNSYFNIFKKNNKVVKMSYSLFDINDISVEPKISNEEAIAIVSSDLDTEFKPVETKDGGVKDIAGADLMIYNGKLAWQVVVPRWRYFIDAENSEILKKESTVRFGYAYGVVRGPYYAHDPTQTLQNSTFEDDYVFLYNGATTVNTTTNESGLYNVTHSGTFSLTSYLWGPYAKVWNSITYPSAATHYVSSISGQHNWNWSSNDTSYKFEESNVYYHINRIHDYFGDGASPFNVSHIDYSINALVEYPGGADYCNAFYYGSEGIGELYFGHGNASMDCENLALGSDIIYHEYTHMVVDGVYGATSFPYTLQTGAMNEGWADYYACTLNGDPAQGDNILPSLYVRYLNNSLVYPDDFDFEVHDDSRMISAAMWELHESLGNDTADELILDAMKMKPMSFTEVLNDLLTSDDDNANLADGTPNSADICDAFESHGIISEYCYSYEGITYADYTNSTSVAVPDNDGWVNSKLVISDVRNITDIQVLVNITHTNTSDLIVKLTEPNGTQLILYDGPSYWGAGTNLVRWYDQDLPPDGDDGWGVRGVTDLESLNNINSNGTWYLNVSDNSAVDTGTIKKFTIRVYYNADGPTVTLNLPSNNNITNQTNINFNCTAYDNINLTNVTLYGNFSGSWTSNGTNSSPINNSYVNFSRTVVQGYYIWNCRACDNESNCAFASSNRILTVDTTAPTYSSNSTNSTVAGYPIKHRLYWQDNYSLVSYMFSFDNGDGTFVNDPWTNMTGTGNWSNVTKTVNSTVGSTIRWKVYANDSVGNWNASLSYTYTTTGPPNITISLTSPEDGQDIEKSSFPASQEFSWTAEDKVNETMNCSLYLNGTLEMSVDCTNSSACPTTLEGLEEQIYYWQVNCSDYENNSEISSEYTFTLSAADIPPKGGGGGGGGGGGEPSVNGTVYDVGDLSNYDNGATTSVGKDDKISFILDSVRHTLTVKSILTDSVVIEIASTPVTVTLPVNKPYNLDLNGDGVNDLSIKLNSLTGSKASITISEIAKPVVTNGQGNQNGRTTLSDVIAGKWGSIWIYLLVIVVVATIFIVVVIHSSKHRKKKLDVR